MALKRVKGMTKRTTKLPRDHSFHRNHDYPVRDMPPLPLQPAIVLSSLPPSFPHSIITSTLSLSSSFPRHTKKRSHHSQTLICSMIDMEQELRVAFLINPRTHYFPSIPTSKKKEKERKKRSPLAYILLVITRWV